jgi:outer membrane lipase/esterase
MDETLHCPAGLNGFSSYPALTSIRRARRRTLQLPHTTCHFKRIFAGCLGALLLSGSAAVAASSSVLTGVSRVIVAGDSLADVGTFGFKYTVQDAANPAGFPVLPELVAAAYGLPATCSHYMDNGAGGVMQRGDPACTNFAVGGGRILHRGDGPQGIPAQLRDAAATVGGRFDPGDLLLMDGGSNDASDLAVAYLAGATSRAGMLALLAFLAREVDVSALLFAAPGDASLARSANLYMEKAADALADAVRANALDRGATRVAVMNVPDITRTPRFSEAFARLVQEFGVDEATAIQAAVRQAIGGYNARLQSRLGNDSRVVLIDFRAAVDDQIARAGDYGLSNAIHAACPVTGVNFVGLAEWNLQTCTSAALDAAAPGVAPGWWASWAFSDGFHPTPAGHRLLAATVNQALAAASWP